MDVRTAAILCGGVDSGHHRNHGALQMNIESLSYLSSALMHAHHNVTGALGRVVSGSQNHEYNERVVREAIRDVSSRSEVVRAELLGCKMQHETTVEVFGYELPSVAYYERDQDDSIRINAVISNGVDVTTLIDSYVIGVMCGEIKDAMQLAADEVACDEA